ncbi:succinate dehydrogenase assembly factor 2 [Leucothrix mucor]|jgi:antitoxin CptB|uniref:FAD assembly factor SdhE n=1 Tax=Leucothrix mucor TaxID=45248 RepID=UPI0003B3A6FD|nr:succinate dehydrogenase assembly factor 2 [Leucothrix mucor]
MSELTRLRWRCRRGAKELDIVMNRYLEQKYETAEASQQQAFNELLAVEDPTIFDLLLERIDAQNDEQQKLLVTLRSIMAL